MKVMGMYFIIAGHFFPVGHVYVYVFSVPLFFIVSGFLGKVETDIRLFWRKLWHNLILPCVLICLLTQALDLITAFRLGAFHWKNIPLHWFKCLSGFQGYGLEAGGLGMCWFIYTLIICRVIYQFVSPRRIIHILTVVICVLVAVLYNVKDMHLYNAVINTSLSYPMYLIGVGYKRIFSKLPIEFKVYWSIPALILLLAIVYFAGNYNGAPWLFDNRYGLNIILFAVGANAGTLVFFIVSYYLQNIRLDSVDTIAKGTIVILGFHQYFIKVFDRIPIAMSSDVLEYAYAFIILILFIPIIKLSERFFPVILGYRVKKLAK